MVSKLLSESGNGGGPASLRRFHRSLALRVLAQQPGIGRSELARQLGLSTMAIGRIVRELEHAGLATEFEQTPPAATRGRPAAGLTLRADGAYVVGAVINAFSPEVHLLNLHGESLASCQVTLDDVTDGPRAVRDACLAIRSLIDNTPQHGAPLVGAGFAVAGNVDASRGVVVGGGYLGWQPFDLAEVATSQLGLPVTVNNMAATLLRAEAFTGCAQSSASATLLHCSTTVSASHVNGDQLQTGCRFRAGRIGHFPIRRTRLVCSCGQSDCLNCVASGWSVLCRLKRTNASVYDLNHIEQYSALTRALVGNESDDESDDKARVNRLLADAGASLAHGLRYLDLTMDPQLIVLSGPLARLDRYVAGVHRGLRAAGPPGADILRKLTSGSISPGQAAGVNALLDTVFSPVLDLNRLLAAQSPDSHRRQSS